jgi:hypothetical protein
MIPFEYGVANEYNKFTWERVTFNNDSSIKSRQYRANYNFDPNDNPLWEQDNSYENGLLQEQIEYTTSRRRNVYSYQNSLLSQIESYGESGLVEKFVYEYSESDNPDRMLEYFIYFDEPTLIHNYTYNQYNILVKDSIDYGDGDSGVLLWEYDSHNNMVKETYDNTVQVIRKYNYELNDRISQYIFNSWFPILEFQKYLYTYSENGQIEQIDVFQSSNGIDGNYEQKGIIKYEYVYN